MRSRYHKYDHLLTGILGALLWPLLWYFVLMGLYDSLEAMDWIEPRSITTDFRQRTSALVAICLNILPLQVFKAQRMDRAMRGVVFPTVFYVGLWLYFFGSAVL